MKNLSFSVLTLVSLALLVTAASASVLSIENGQVTAIGNTAAVNMKLDTAPAGLSGYSINITVGDPSVATITAVSFPAWAALSDTSTLPSSSCQIKAVDLNEQVQSGALDIPLAAITLQGLKAGSTPVTITLNKMNDDVDALVQPAITSSTFTVTVAAGAMTVTKSASPASLQDSGEVTYTYLVKNTGTVPISGLTLADDKLGMVSGPLSGDTDSNTVLDAGETWTYSVAATLSQTTTNTAVAAGMEPTGQPVSTQSNAVTVQVGAIATPEFPSPVLPVMLIGAVGLFMVILKRRN
jgi:hypothetical protein